MGQVWRGGSGRQARLAALLAALHTAALDASLGRRAGVLLGRARATDVVDAALVLLAVDGDSIVTSDPKGMVIVEAPMETTTPPSVIADTTQR